MTAIFGNSMSHIENIISQNPIFPSSQVLTSRNEAPTRLQKPKGQTRRRNEKHQLWKRYVQHRKPPVSNALFIAKLPLTSMELQNVSHLPQNVPHLPRKSSLRCWKCHAHRKPPVSNALFTMRLQLVCRSQEDKQKGGTMKTSTVKTSCSTSKTSCLKCTVRYVYTSIFVTISRENPQVTSGLRKSTCF